MPEDVPSKNGYKRTELEEIKNDMEHVKNILGIIGEEWRNFNRKRAWRGGFVFFMDGIYNLRDEIYTTDLEKDLRFSLTRTMRM